MMRFALLAAIGLMAGAVGSADERAAQGKTFSSDRVAVLQAQAAAQGKTREQLNAVIEELVEQVAEKRSELQLSEAALRELKNIRDKAQEVERVRPEYGVPTLHGGKKTFRNIGVGRTPQSGKPDHERRLEEIERKLDRVLKELESMRKDSKGKEQTIIPS